MKLITFVLFSLLCFQGAIGQYLTEEEERAIDSLNLIIDDPSSHDTSVASAYLGLSEILYLINPDTLMHLCTQSQIVAEKALQNETDEVVRTSLINSLGGAVNNIGYVYDQHGDVIKALEYYHTSLELKRKAGDDKGVATSLNNIGFTYDDLGDYQTALDYYFEALSMRQKIGNKFDIANSYNNIGYVYDLQGEKEKGLEYYQKALELQLDIQDTEGAALSLNNIGSIHQDQGNNMDALSCFLRSSSMFEEAGDLQGCVFACVNLAQIYLALDEVDEAHVYAEKGMRLAQEMGFPDEIISASRVLSEVYEKKKDGMKALAVYKIFKTMTDSVYNDEIKRAAIERKAEYQYEQQKVIDDAEHLRDLLSEKEGKERQQLLTIAGFIGLAFVALFLVFVINRLRLTRRQKQVIEETHAELEHKSNEILDSIKYAKRIQKAILPSSAMVDKHLSNGFVIYQPKDIISGDFYWLEERKETVLFAVADCTGHGVPGAMVSVVCNNALNRAVREHGIVDPGKILTKAREIVIGEFDKSDEMVRDGMDIALCALDIKNMKIQYAGAMNPLWIAREGEMIRFRADRQAICKTDQLVDFTTHEIALKKGDVLYLFSDGYADQFGGPHGKKFKGKNLQQLFLEVSHQPLSEQRNIILDRFQEWKGSMEQVDDLCIIGLKI